MTMDSGSINILFIKVTYQCEEFMIGVSFVLDMWAGKLTQIPELDLLKRYTSESDIFILCM